MDCIVNLPGKLFLNTQIPASLWFLSRDKSNDKFRNREDEILFIAELNDTIIGVVHIGIRTAPYIDIMVPRRYVVIDNIVVLKAHRNKAVGKKLMKKAKKTVAHIRQIVGAIE